MGVQWWWFWTLHLTEPPGKRWRANMMRWRKDIIKPACSFKYSNCSRVCGSRISLHKHEMAQVPTMQIFHLSITPNWSRGHHQPPSTATTSHWSISTYVTTSPESDETYVSLDMFPSLGTLLSPFQGRPFVSFPLILCCLVTLQRGSLHRNAGSYLYSVCVCVLRFLLRKWALWNPQGMMDKCPIRHVIICNMEYISGGKNG